MREIVRLLRRLKSWATSIKRDVIALWLAVRDPRTPRTARVIAAIVVGYALSPIDLIPDFVPVFGYLDDLVLVPLGILAAVKLIPPELMREFRMEAARLSKRPASRIAAVLIACIWLALAVMIGWAVYSRLAG